MEDRAMSDDQIHLFDVETGQEEEWYGMPEYIHKKMTPEYQIIVSFANREDMKKFAELIKQPITIKTQSVWYPEAEISRYSDKRYIDES